MKPERIALYLQHLSSLSERQINYAFTRAMNECTWVPKIAEIRKFAGEGAELFQRQDAEARSKRLLAAARKPEDWNPHLDDVWAELDSRAQAQERSDLRFLEENSISDERIAEVLKTCVLPPFGLRYCDWVRMKEARDRQKSGQPLRSMRPQFGPMFEKIAHSDREPGCDDE